MLDLHPFTLLVLVLVVLVLKNSVNAIGKSRVQDFGWSIYTWMAPKLGHKQFLELKGKRSELARVGKEKKSISAQDEYARWTKLNRQFDKLNGEISQLTESISANKTSISSMIGWAITIFTSLPIWFCRAWFRKSVLFYLPVGVLPHYLEWFLALPFFPTGSIGLTAWMFALNHVIGSVILLVSFPFEKPVDKPVKPEPTESSTEKTPTKDQTVPEVTAEKI